MPPMTPPHGMSEVDYATIEAAVTETVRGRWFLNEFARRNRAAELRQLLDAMARIESAVGAGTSALPPADPSIRLLMQRIKDIAGQLDTISREMREAGVDERFAAAVEKEARAVAGMMRGPVPTAATATRAPAALRKPDTLIAAPIPREPVDGAIATIHQSAELASSAVMGSVTTKTIQPAPGSPHLAGEDPRLARLEDLDRLSLAEKLVLFG